METLVVLDDLLPWLRRHTVGYDDANEPIKKSNYLNQKIRPSARLRGVGAKSSDAELFQARRSGRRRQKVVLNLNPQGADGIDAGGAAGREEAGEQRNRDQNNQSCAERDWVARAHFIKQVGHQARQQQCRGAADHDSGDG